MKRTINILLLFFSISVMAQSGEDFTHKDRAASLYATRLTFNAKHIPVITIGIMDGQQRITITSKQGLVFLPDGEGGPAITMGKRNVSCTATLKQTRPAVVKYYVVLDRIPATDLSLFAQRFKALQDQGYTLKQFQVGSVFGFYGHILDNRRILIVRDRPYQNLARAKAEQKKVRPDLEVHASLVTPPKGRIMVTCKGFKTTIESDAYLYFRSTRKAPVTVKAVEFGKGFSWHSREDRRYKGLMYFAVDRHGRLAVVDAVDAETLLTGLVPSEMPTSAPLSALKAQAVAARNELFAQLGTRHTADPFMMCSDVHCQVYRGLGREHPSTTKAVRATIGKMLFKNNRLLDTVYSSNCGGINESPTAIWGTKDSPLPGGLVDAQPRTKLDLSNEKALKNFIDSPPSGIFCASQRTFRWVKTRTRQQLRVSVMNRTGLDPGTITDLIVLKRGVSGRALQLQVKGKKRTITLNSELTIRQALGGLRSALFVMEKKRKGKTLVSVTFRGGGFGHGAGMCQTGAMGMAKHGKGFKTILYHYYPGSKLLRIY